MLKWPLILLSFIGIGWSQEPVRVNTRIRFIGFERPLTGIGVLENQTFEELRIPSTKIAGIFEYSGENQFYLYRKGAGEEPAFVPVAQVQIPEGMPEVLVVLFENPEQGENQPEYLVRAVNFSIQAFPEGSYFLWNMTSKRLVGQVGNQSFNLSSRGTQVFSPGVESSAALDAKIMYYPDPDRESLEIKKWFYNPRFRKMMIFLEDPEGQNHFRLKALRVR